MPTYDYLCAACGHTFERFESIGEEGSKACPKCGRKRAKRRLGTGAGLIFKGSGFYVTDYKHGSAAKKPGKSDASDKGEKSETSKTEAKSKEKESKK
jgi:putative FmdB family regulatory protein